MSFSSGDGERSWRAPKKLIGSFCCPNANRRPRAYSGMSGTSGISSGRGGTPSSGVGGIRLIRGCIDLGRSISPEKASSTSVRRPKPAEVGAGDSSRSDPESCDMDRKYSERP
jgi:hypothetical protein